VARISGVPLFVRPGVALAAVVAVVAGISFAAFELTEPDSPAVAESSAATPSILSGGPVLTANWYESAPYYFVTDNSAPDLGDVIENTGQKAFVMSFVRAPSAGGCVPTWGSTDPVSTDTRVTGIVREVREHGGGISVSVGGGGGTALGQVCGTPQATAAAYKTVLDKYQVRAIDFDIERTELQTPNAVANELGAAQILEKETPGLFVTITIPSTANGADSHGVQLLEQAQRDQLSVAAYTIMPFDDNFHGATAQQVALEGFNQQLQSVFGWSALQSWEHEGISQMNGEADTAEYFSETDFASNLKFAETHHMARYTFWSMNRDRQCDPASNDGQVSTDCSSVAQSTYAFTRYDTKFAEWTAPAAN
jgi:chitinase